METLIKFYVDIEFAGENMFYTKFQYRHDCSCLFQRFWPSDFHKNKVKQLNGSQVFEKFLNCLINDLTFCLEEGLEKLKSIKAFENK